MFDNIKKRIADNTADIIIKSKAANDDTALVAEYCQVIEELSDLTVDGDGSSRSIELLLDNNGELEPDEIDDIELEEIGYNLKTGTIDVLSDAAITTEYASMKSEDYFFTESENLIELENEDPDSYDERRKRYAEKCWMRYRQQVLQEGAFGYKKVNATCDSVPSFTTINFGNYRGSAYNVRIPIQHQVDRKGNLTRHQLESIYLAESCGLCSNLIDRVKEDLSNRYSIPANGSIWDTIIPAVFVAPIDPIDKHSVIVGFKNDANLSGMDFYRFTNPVCEYDTSDSVLPHSSVERLDNNKVRELSKFCITKNAAIKESQKAYPNYHRFVQEAIDLGGDDTQNAAPAQAQDQNAAPPPADNNAAAPTDSNDQQSAPATVNVGKNDVSDAIVKGAEDATTKNNEPTEGEDSNTDLPDDMGEVPSLDGMDDSNNGLDADNMGATPDEDLSNIDPDKTLAELNNEGNENEALGDGDLSAGEVDIDNMSIDQLLQQGTEALKGMSIQQLKEFLANNDSKAVTEAFILTNANINDEVDVLLRKTLGVLNDNKMEITKLVSEFKKYGKRLNRVLTKASKATKVYNNNEIDNIKKLNKALADLMVTIKASTDGSSIQVIKRLMKAFTSQAAIVGKIVEKKKNELPKAKVSEKKNVQESAAYNFDEFDYIQEALFTTAKTARENVLLRSGSVAKDMAKIVKAAEDDKLSRGMIQKMYGGITKQVTTSIDGSSEDSTISTGYSTTRDYHIDSVEMDHLTSLIYLVNKITRKAAKKEKWSIAFTNKEFAALSQLKDDVAEFAEDTEYLLADTTSTSEKLIKAIAKEAKKISEECKDISEWPRSI